MSDQGSPAAEGKGASIGYRGVSPARVKRFARLTRRAALYRYTPGKIIPTVGSGLYCDYEKVLAWRKEQNEGRPPERKITLNHVLMKAIAQALRNHIFLNYAWDGGKKLHPVKQIHLRAPVDLGDMMQYVVVPNTDRLSVGEIADRFHDGLAALAEPSETPIERRLKIFALPTFLLTPLMFLGSILKFFLRLFPRAHAKSLARQRQWLGSFMVTNPGTLGTETGQGLLVRPSIAFAGVWVIKPTPVPQQDGTIEVRRMGRVSVVYDHRFIDAPQATRFLLEVKRNLEDPEQYLQREPAPPMFPGTIGGVVP